MIQLQFNGNIVFHFDFLNVKREENQTSIQSLEENSVNMYNGTDLCDSLK